MLPKSTGCLFLPGSYGVYVFTEPLQWRQNKRDGVYNHRPMDCLPNRLFRWRSKKTSTLRVTGLCEGNSPVISEFLAQRASNEGNVSIWWRHHATIIPMMPTLSSFMVPTSELHSKCDIYHRDKMAASACIIVLCIGKLTVDSHEELFQPSIFIQSS